MVRPCDNCGGWGKDVVQSTRGPLETNTIICPVCKDMPWLTWEAYAQWYEGSYDVDIYQDRKPQPDTVMHWCQTHKSVALTAGVNCYRQLHESEYGESLDGDCDIVWVEKPSTALKVAK